MEFLEKEIRRNERCKTLSGLTDPGEKKTEAHHKKFQSNQSSAAALQNSSSVRKCDFCDMKNHVSAYCYRYLNLDARERQKKVEQIRLCFRCLSRSHIA